MFRDQTEFQCDNPTKGSQFLATCLLGGLWQTSGFSACQNADATSTCVVKKLPNGWITKLDRQSGQMTYECSRGFRAASSGVAQCTNGEWTPEPKCEPITCGPLESEPLPTSPPDEGIVEAVPSESASSFPVYKRVKYECADNNRYALRGTANYRQCLESGEWTYPEIFCQELKCGLNSTIKYSDNRPYEMKVAESDALICRPGYNSSLSNAGNEFTCKKAEPSLYDPDLSSVWCTPYDFCSNPNVCLPDGQCEALYNGYFCDCKQGYEDTDGQCTDIDECSLKISDCTNAKCVNQPGTYDCSCEQGFIPPTKEVAVSEKSSVIPDVTCIPTRCPIPVAPAEDRYMVTDDPLFEPSTSVKFYMNARPGPVHRMRCLPNGTWESLLPNKQLSLITCPMFPLASAVIAEPTK
ncbi:hypothetical protein M3Y99_01266500 [Aphelenchoides fujianensis]|nr:hypothetical protein M3Y99_01266500 [Aphelenchoides fujianensis]